jgi:uncharacterized protein
VITKDTLPLPQNPEWVRDRIIFLTLSGSHAYGTNIEGSDEDYRGVCTLPETVVYGFNENFDQLESHGDPDLTIFSIKKFAHLACQNNPNVLEFLFVDESSILYRTPAWDRLRDIRHMFLSKRLAQTFAGYAKAQLHKIRTHRAYLPNPVLQIPTREEFGLPPRAMVPKLHAADAQVQKVLDTIAGEWSIDKVEQLKLYPEVGEALGFETNFIELLYKEKRYAARVAEKKAYDEWAKTRNPKRRALEQKCGYDSKHLMHLVRLYRMCEECLRTGDLLVKRPDAAELIEIRNGSWPFEKIEAWASDAESRIQVALKNTPLPSRPNLSIIENVVMNIIKEGMNP